MMKFPDVMTPHEKAELLRLIEKIPTLRVCPDCVSFDMGFCNKFNEPIPSEWLDKGCDEYIFDKNSPPF